MARLLKTRKKIFLYFFLPVVVLIFCNVSNAQNHPEKEYVILRVQHFIKPSGVEARLNIEIGTSINHSLKGKIENGPSNTVNYNKSDGTTQVFNNEVDMISFLAGNGFNIKHVYETNLGGRTNINYLFEKTK